MSRISGLILKKEGLVIVTDNKKAVIKWIESGIRKRTYFYLICIHGKKYTKPYRLKPYEIDYWIDTIERKIKEWI